MNAIFYKAAGALIAPFRYAQREVNELKEHAKDDIHVLIVNAVKVAGMVLAALFFVLFISFTAAGAINRGVGNDWLGYAVVAGFYLLVGAGIYIWKEMSDKKRREASA